MKVYYLLALVLTLGIGVVFFSKTDVANVLGVNTTRSESHEICWPDIKEASNGYQLYYGQATTGIKDTTIPGLNKYSRCVKLSSLKSCTDYVWNLYRNDAGKWSWAWKTDQRFNSGGPCTETPMTTTGTVITGNASGTASWSPINGALKYYVFYRAAGDANWTHSVELSPKSSSYTIGYLDPNMAYMYRVAALVKNKLVWQNEMNLVVQ